MEYLYFFFIIEVIITFFNFKIYRLNVIFTFKVHRRLKERNNARLKKFSMSVQIWFYKNLLKVSQTYFEKIYFSKKHRQLNLTICAQIWHRIPVNIIIKKKNIAQLSFRLPTFRLSSELNPKLCAYKSERLIVWPERSS